MRIINFFRRVQDEKVQDEKVCDCDVDLDDFALLSRHWLESDFLYTVIE